MAAPWPRNTTRPAMTNSYIPDCLWYLEREPHPLSRGLSIEASRLLSHRKLILLVPESIQNEIQELPPGQIYDTFLLACLNSPIEVVECLIKAGADVCSVNKTGKPALVLASYAGHLSTVACLLSHGAYVDHSDEDGKTALMWASWWGHHDVVRRLLDQGASMSVVDHANKTALMWACEAGHLRVVLVLLAGPEISQGEEPWEDTLRPVLECTDDYGNTALQLAMKLPDGVDRCGILNCLKAAGAAGAAGANLDVDSCRTLTNAVVSLLKSRSSITAEELLIMKGIVQELKCCNIPGQDIRLQKIVQGRQRRNIQLIRLTNQNSKCAATRSIEALLQAGAQVTYDDIDICECIFNFADQEDLIFQLLQRLGVPESNATNANCSPLMAAILSANERLIMRFVLQNALTASDLYPSAGCLDYLKRHLEAVGEHRQSMMIEGLYSQPWTLQTMCLVAVSSCIGSTANREQSLGQTGLPESLWREIAFQPTPLHPLAYLRNWWAERFGRIDEDLMPSPRPTPSHSFLLNLARRTVASMKRDDLCHTDRDGDTNLHIAVSDTDVDQFMVQAVLERLVRERLQDMVDRCNNMGQTPLYLAVSTNNPCKVTCLLEFGADVLPLAERHHPSGAISHHAAIHCVASAGVTHLSTLTALIAPRTDRHRQTHRQHLNLENSDGHTALHCAILAHGKNTPSGVINSIPVIQALMKAGADPNLQVTNNGKTALMFALESHNLDLIEATFSLVEPSRLPAYLKTQSSDNNSCHKLAAHLTSLLKNDPIRQHRLAACLKPPGHPRTSSLSPL